MIEHRGDQSGENRTRYLTVIFGVYLSCGDLPISCFLFATTITIEWHG